ncbi:pterin-4-alpha-carbinolamine dehydratase 2, partial [Eremomyces bilateralis CBS 781.70]
WTHHASPPSLTRTFLFPTFKSAMSFITRVADLAARERHHPEWANVYNRVMVRWVTHRPRDGPEGPRVTELDVRVARECEEIAGDVGL